MSSEYARGTLPTLTRSRKMGDRPPRHHARVENTSLCHRSEHGHTLVEIVVVIVLVGTLVSISFFSLSTARSSARLTLCTTRLRSCLALHFDHAASNQDRFINAGPDEHLQPSPSGTLVRVGGSRGYPNGTWAIALPDEWTGTAFSRALRCPRDPYWNKGSLGTPSSFPAYWMSLALWLDPASLREPTPADALRWHSNRVGDVLFPSRKVLLFEQVAYCTANPRAATDIQNGHTFTWPASLGFVDGSVRRFARSDGLPGHHSLPFDATVNGVQGVDVR